MDQSHLGYTSWADPPVNSLRAIQLKHIDIPDKAIMGVAVDGSEDTWPGPPDDPRLPGFDIFSRGSHYIEVFNKGSVPFEYSVSSDDPWIKISRNKGTAIKDERIIITVDWNKISREKNDGIIVVSGAGSVVNIRVSAFKPVNITPETLEGFAESDGYVSIEAEHFSNNIPEGDRKWIRIEDYGHTLSAMRANGPVDSPPADPGKDSPCLEYKIYLFTAAETEVVSTFSPTLNFVPGNSMQYGISFDDQPVRIVTLVPENYNAQNGNRDWEKTVSDNARISETKHLISSPGYHTLKIWMIQPGVVLEKIVINTGGLKPSYLGPPESFHR